MVYPAINAQRSPRTVHAANTLSLFEKTVIATKLTKNGVRDIVITLLYQSAECKMLEGSAAKKNGSFNARIRITGIAVS
jgi:hypothetical protein